MLTIEANRSAYMTHLSGVGILIAGAATPVTASKPNWNPSEFGKRLLVIEDDRFLPVAKQKTHALLANVLTTKPWSFIFADHQIATLSNPLKTLVNWASFLKPFGHIVIANSFSASSPDKHRPITRLDHLISDYRVHTQTPCDEHILSFVWAWNPGAFPNPDEILVVLEDMWRRCIFDLDTQSYSLVRSAGNKEAIRSALAKGHNEIINHHVFDVTLILESVAWISENCDVCLVPIDIGLAKGNLSEYVIVFQNYPMDFARSAQGRAMIQSQTNTFLRVMQAEVWTDQEIGLLKAFIG